MRYFLVQHRECYGMDIFFARNDDTKFRLVVRQDVNEEHDDTDQLISNSWLEKEYDAQGILIIQSKIKCEYEHNKLIHQIKYQHSPRGELMGHTETFLEYDSTQKLTYKKEMIFNAESQIIGKNEFYYNELGQINFSKKFEYTVGMYSAGKKAVFKSNSKFSYDIDHHVLEEETSSYSNGRLVEMYNIEYYANKIVSKNIRIFNYQGQLLSKSLYKYNDKGKLVEGIEFEYDKDNNVVGKCRMYYGSDNNIARKKMFKYNSDNRVIDAGEFCYDEKERLTCYKKSKYDDSKIVGSSHEDYDTAGLLKQASLSKYADRQYIGYDESFYKYDTDGHVVKVSTCRYDANGKFTDRSEIKYQYHDGKTVLQTEQRYDANNRLLKSSESDFGDGAAFTSGDLRIDATLANKKLTQEIHSWVNVSKQTVSISAPNPARPLLHSMVQGYWPKSVTN